MQIVFLIIAFTLNATANLLLKMSTQYGLVFSDMRALLFSKATLFLVLGLGAFAANVVFYYLALRHLPLSVAYPVMVGATALLTGVTAVYLLHENISLLQIVGYVLIILGITCVFTFRA